jgi:hypothetical protein
MHAKNWRHRAENWSGLRHRLRLADKTLISSLQIPSLRSALYKFRAKVETADVSANIDVPMKDAI